MNNALWEKFKEWAPFASKATGVLDSTKITTFLNCPRKYLFEHVLGITPDRPNKHLISGVAWHKTMETLVLTRDVEAAYETYLELFFKDFPRELADTLPPKDPANIYEALKVYMDFTKDDPTDYDILSVETCEEIDLGAEATIYAKIDLVLREHSTGLVVGRDYKTTGMDIDPLYELNIQMLNYLMALHGIYGVEEVDRYEVDRIVFRKSNKVHGSKGGKGNKIDRFYVTPSTELMRLHRGAMLRVLGEISNEADLLASGPKEDFTMAFPPNFTSCDDYGGCQFCGLCAAGVDPVNYSDELERVPTGFKRHYWDPSEEE